MADDAESTGPSVRESLESAISATQAPAAPAPEAPPTPVKTEEAPKLAAKDSAKVATSPTRKEPEIAKGVSNPKGETDTAEAKPEVPSLKAPNSWKPLVKEKWAALPREVQAEVIRREREAQSVITQSDEARKGWGEFKETVAPYEAFFRAEGAKPIEAVKSLFDTAVALRTAPPATKASMIAGMIRNFGVPIEMLAQALDGQAPQQEPQREQYRDPRVDELLQRIERANEQRNQSVSQKYTSEASSFAQEHEFFDDVKESMAKLIESGFAEDYSEAYEKACMLDKDISTVLKQRQQAERIKQQQSGAIQKSRNAAASIRSRPSISPKDSNRPNDVRSALEASIIAHSR